MVWGVVLGLVGGVVWDEVLDATRDKGRGDAWDRAYHVTLPISWYYKTEVSKSWYINFYSTIYLGTLLLNTSVAVIEYTRCSYWIHMLQLLNTPVVVIEYISCSYWIHQLQLLNIPVVVIEYISCSYWIYLLQFLNISVAVIEYISCSYWIHQLKLLNTSVAVFEYISCSYWIHQLQLLSVYCCHGFDQVSYYSFWQLQLRYDLAVLIRAISAN